MTKENGPAVTLVDYTLRYAEEFPDKRAIVFPEGRDSHGRVCYSHLTFAQLSRDVNAYAAGLAHVGVTPGMKVSLMVMPGLEFLPLTLALFTIGATPVLIDPGMGKSNLLNCIQGVAPEAFIGIPKAQLAKLLFPKYFKSVTINVTIGRKLFWGGHRMSDVYRPDLECPEVTISSDDLAAVLFTTGSTGPPKGVEYTHGMFCAQRNALRDAFGLTSDDVDMPAFAMFSIFTLALGCTVVIPDMDQTKPAQVEPTRIIETITDHGVTISFGSPALWDTVSVYCIDKGVTLSSLKKVFMAGAPIRPYLHERMLGKVLTEGAEVFTPYGATECLPVSSFEGTAVLAETAAMTMSGKGYCVGKPMPNLDVKIIEICDKPIPSFTDVKELPKGDVGEIIVKGPVVSRRYFNLPDKTAEHKIYEGDPETGPFWHRIGDLGRFDEQGRLWMCGRKTHSVVCGGVRHFTVCCEAIFNGHPEVFRSALVGIGDDPKNQVPVIIIEPKPGKFPANATAEKAFGKSILELAKNNDLTQAVEIVLFHRSFPVDIRHNAKIFREKLAIWARGELKR